MEKLKTKQLRHVLVPSECLKKYTRKMMNTYENIVIRVLTTL